LHTTHHWRATLHHRTSSVQNTLSSSGSSYTRDGHRNSVWSDRASRSAPISSRKDANMRLFRGLVFTKFTMRTTSVNTGAWSAGHVLATSASRCKRHWSPPCSRYSDVTRNIFSPVVSFSGNDFQNRKLSLTVSPSKKRTLANRAATNNYFNNRLIYRLFFGWVD